MRRDTPRDLSNNSWNQSTAQLESRQRNHFRQQEDAVLLLKIVSQPPEVPMDYLLGYDYMVQAGKGITIYIIDSGANLNHPVSIFFKV